METQSLTENHVSSSRLSVCLVIPTYNEAENIETLLSLLFSKERRQAYHDQNIIMHALVVDDNSPDGTASIVKALQQKNHHVHLLDRSKKNGLGAAYIAGMQHALFSLKPDVLFEMDADLSHDPAYILPMIEEIRSGADVVIGSRYTEGGSLPPDWGLSRRLISKGANMYAKTILRIKDVSDVTGGFRAIRAFVLYSIDLNSLDVKGYAFQISLLDAIVGHGFKVREIPIAFHDRSFGESKLGISDIVEVGTSVFRLAWKSRFPKEKMDHSPFRRKEAGQGL